MRTGYSKILAVSFLVILIFSQLSYGVEKTKTSMSLNNFLMKQGFPKQLSQESIEKLGLLRDGTRYGKKEGGCATSGFYYGGIEFTGWPFLFKTISPDSDSKPLNNSDLEREFKKLAEEFGKPLLIQRSKEQIWPPQRGGDIEHITFKIDEYGAAVSVDFVISANHCVRAHVYYK